MNSHELRVCVRDRNTGAVNMEQYYLNGQWAKDGNHVWRYAVEEASKMARKIGGPVGICYAGGPVVGGVVPNDPC